MRRASLILKIKTIAALLCFALIAGSFFYRTQKSKPILRPQFSQVRFEETWCSGRSDRSFLSRMVAARHLLWVAVTKDALHVSPHVPFNLMFFAEAFGWDHRVPGRTIVDIRESSQSSGGTRVAIRYRHTTGDEEILELTVRNVAGLMSALRKLRGGLN